MSRTPRIQRSNILVRTLVRTAHIHGVGILHVGEIEEAADIGDPSGTGHNGGEACLK